MTDPDRHPRDRSRHAETAADMPTVAEMAAMTGMEFIEGVRDGRLTAAPIARTLNFWMEEVADGRAVFRGRAPFRAYNPLGAVHGGWFGAILDSCMACAAHTKLPRGRSYTTLEYKINILRPLTEASGEVLAIGEAVHVGRRTATAEGRVIGAEDGKLYATGSTTCLVMELD